MRQYRILTKLLRILPPKTIKQIRRLVQLCHQALFTHNDCYVLVFAYTVLYIWAIWIMRAIDS